MILCVSFVFSYYFDSTAHADPEKGSPGSVITPPPFTGLKTQYVAHHLLDVTPYAVFSSCPVIRRTTPESAALLIPEPWYTSGNTKIHDKSDLPRSAAR